MSVTQDHRLPHPGQLVAARYRLVRLVGEGGFAAVFEAEDTTAGGRCAVKVLVPNHHLGAKLLMRFYQEVRVVRELRHPNTIKIWDVGTTKSGCPYYVMEFADGVSLDEVVHRIGPLPTERAVHIIKQVLGALSEAHACGVIHRDLKPGNILITNPAGQRDFVKLIDFGIAKTLNRALAMVFTEEGDRPLLTPAFAAPEQILGRPVSAATDLYAMGMVLGAMLHGQYLLPTDSVAYLVDYLRSPEPASLPAKLERHPLGRVISRAIAKDPTQRWQTVDEMLEAIERVTGPVNRSAVSVQSNAIRTVPLPAVEGIELTLELPSLRSTEPNPASEPDREGIELTLELLSLRSTEPNPASEPDVFGGAASGLPEARLITVQISDESKAQGAWSTQIGALEREAQDEENPHRIAELYTEIGIILNEHVGDFEGAVDYFNRALDASTKNISPFTCLERMLIDHKSWRTLDLSYRFMIKRLQVLGEDNSDMSYRLWSSLARLHDKQLKSSDGATAAYEVLARLSPGDLDVHLRLAELYADRGDHATAASSWGRAIALAPTHYEAYHARFDACLRASNYDGAWCVASALTVLQQATEAESKSHREYVTNALRIAKCSLLDEHHRLLRHPDLDVELGALLAALSLELRSLYSVDLKKSWRLHKRKDQLDLSRSAPLTKAINDVFRVCAPKEKPKVYLQSAYSGGIRNANTNPPALVVHSDVVARCDERLLAFAVAKAVYLLRPEFYLGSTALGISVLKQVVSTALALGGQTADKPSAQLLGEIRARPSWAASVLEATRRLVQKKTEADFPKWLEAADYTTDRVGLLICGSLPVAINAVRGEMSPLSKATTADRIRELVSFTTSDDYLLLRRALGISWHDLDTVELARS